MDIRTGAAGLCQSFQCASFTSVSVQDPSCHCECSLLCFKTYHTLDKRPENPICIRPSPLPQLHLPLLLMIYCGPVCDVPVGALPLGR